MKLSSQSLQHGQPIPADFAFCTPTGGGDHVRHSGNKNPHLAWTDAPEGTRSFALVCHDPDVPAYGDGVNTEGETVEADRERTDFFHWLLVDIPTAVTEIPEGAVSDGVTVEGKDPGRSQYGLAGTNDYTDWFEGDDEMEGTYGGYDGPCPPWNDERLHHYHFTVYALDTDSLGVDPAGDFTGDDLLDALEGHILAQAEIVGTYTTNPDVQ